MTAFYEEGDGLLEAVTEALEGAVIQAVATENPMADVLGQILFLARRGHKPSLELGVYVAFMRRFEDHPEVSKIRIAQLIAKRRTHPPKT